MTPAPIRGGASARLRAALSETTQRLGAAGVPSPSADARALLAAAARTDRPLILLDELPADFEEALEPLVARREAREPLQLILGTAPFRRLALKVAPGVFIPRPETEVAIDLLLDVARQDGADSMRTVVDLCTGSGALAAAVLDELPQAQVLAVEVDPVAAALARKNLEASGPGRHRVLEADLLAADDLPGAVADGSADAVISNPPYVPAGAVPKEREVLEHDPERALYGGGADGMEVPEAVIARAARMLRPGGALIMEHADVQGARTREAAARHGGFERIATAQDLTGRDRFLTARRAGRDPDEPK